MENDWTGGESLGNWAVVVSTMSWPKPRTSLSDLTSMLLLGKYQPPRDESEGEGGSVSE